MSFKKNLGLTIALIFWFNEAYAISAITRSVKPRVDDPECKSAETLGLAPEFQALLGQFAGKPESCLANRSELESLPSKDALRREAENCDCFFQSNDPSVKLGKGFTPSTQMQSYDLDVAETLIEMQNARLNIKRNGLAFQASVISPGKMVEAYSLTEIERTLTEPNSKGTPKKIIQDELAQNVVKSGLQKLGAEEFIAKANSKLRAGGLNPAIFDQQDETKKATTDESMGACVSPKEFLAFNSVPRLNDFYKDLASMKSFKEEDWDIKKLEENRKKLRASGNISQANHLGARIKFLNNNPLIKNLFASSKEDNDIFKNIDPQKHAKLNSKKEIFDKLPGYKEELFKIVKSLSPEKDCGMSSNDCLKQVGSQKVMGDFRDKMEDFFADAPVAILTKIEAEKDLFREMTNPGYLTDEMVLPRDPKKLDELVNTIYGKSSFKDHCDTNFIRESRSRDFQLMQCASAMRNYCPLVKLATELPPISKEQQEDESDELDALNDLNPDMKKNKRYEKFNQKVCQTKRVKAANLNVPGVKLSSPSNFVDFRNEYCGAKKNAPECSADKRVELVSLYLQYYPEKKNSDDPRLKESREALDAEDAELMAFSNFLKGNEALTQKMDKKEFDKLAKESVKEEELENIFSGVKKDKIERKKRLADLLAADNFNPAPSEPTGSTGFSPEEFLKKFTGDSSNDESQNNFNRSSGSVSAPLAPSASPSSSNLASAERTFEKNSRERKNLKEELDELNEQYKNTKDDSEKRDLENRMTLLEQLLAQKDASLNEYKKLLDDLREEKKQAPNQGSTVASGHNNKSDGNEEPKAKPQHVNQPDLGNEAPGARAAAGVKESTNVNNGSGAVAKLSKAPKSSAASELNAALLKKYELELDEISVEGVILVNQEKELPTKAVELLTKAQRGNNLPLKVSSEVYQDIESRNLETLKKYVVTKINPNAPVTKVSVTSPGKLELHFYAIKMDGKVILQPIRKASLLDLQRELGGVSNQNQ